MIWSGTGAQHFQCQLDHRFGVGPRHQRRRRKLQRQTPEFLGSENTRDRLTREAAARKVLQPHGLSRGDGPRRGRDEAGQVETQRRADQNPRVEFRRIDCVCPEPGRQRAPRRFDGVSGERMAHAAAPWAASWAA